MAEEDTPRADPVEAMKFWGLDREGLAAAQGYDQSYSRIEKVRYSHDAMIDVIIAEPAIKQKELAERFGMTQAWISRVIGSDAFQARLAARKEKVIDPVLTHNMEERLRGLAIQSLEIVQEKLEATGSADMAMKALDLSTKALGFGARERNGGAQVQNNFVIALPGKAASAQEWAAAHGPQTPLIEAKKIG